MQHTATSAEQSELFFAIGQHNNLLNILTEKIKFDFKQTETITPENKKEILDAIISGAAHVSAENEIRQVIRPQAADFQFSQNPSVNLVHRIHFLKRRWVGYAAALLVLILGTTAYYFISTSQSNQQIVQTPPHKLNEDILPGSDKALLTLSTGEKVQLNNAAFDTITDRKLSIKNSKGQLSYFGEQSGEYEAVFNTMTTPKGGEYKLILADGTNVWLNASSSISYPTAFNGTTREVKLTGEAYFEVAKNKLKPFIVKTITDDILVVGTHFNINAYPDESAVKTSLLEGSVKIKEKMLKPGQAYINGNIMPTDVAQDVAWKNNLFNFNNQNLQAVMRQLARWYDLDVQFEGAISNDTLKGEMGRDLSFEQVQRILKKMEINFSMQGRKMIVSK